MQNNKTGKQTLRHRLPLIGLLCLLVLYATAQTYISQDMKGQLYAYGIDQNIPTKKDSTNNKKDTVKKTATKGAPRLINLLYSSIWKKRAGTDIEVLIDSVKFLHDGAYLYCDSAHFNRITNTFEAYSNVRMEQGDTLFLYGDYMHYDGNIKLARVRENVKMDHRSGTLFTDSLNYDRVKNIGYYFEGGMLVDSLNELTSLWGQYEPSRSLATFTDEVVLDNPNFKLFSDTLLYSTETKIANIVGPTRIESDSGTIYSTRGWYNTMTEQSLLLDQSTVVNKEKDKYLKGDSIIFYRDINNAEVFGNMFLQDTAKKVILTGHYGFYNGSTDYAFATDSARAIEYSQGDSLYLHADTLELIKLPPTEVLVLKYTTDTLKIHDEAEDIVIDSITTHVDSVKQMKEFHEIKGYHGVRFYRSDMQGICDSLQFNSSDSILHMYKEPVLWSENRQLTGDTIHMFMNDSTIDRMYVVGSAFSIEQKDSLHFNQLKSKLLNFYFEGKNLRRVFAEGNVQTIAYPEEKDGALNEIHNWMECSYLEIWLEEGQFSRLKGWPAIVGRTTPFHLLEPEKLRLDNFFWYDYLRPLDKDDVFRKVKRKAGDQAPPRAAYWDRED